MGGGPPLRQPQQLMTVTTTRPDLAELIGQLADWSEPDRRGTRHAYPQEPFWRMWRTDKAAMRNAGVFVRRRDGRWTATWTPQPATADEWLEQLADWGPPRILITSRGPRTVRNAVPDERLWTQWRDNRDTLKDHGVYIAQSDRQWTADWWQTWQPDPDIIEAATAAEPDPTQPAVPVPDGLEYLPFQLAGIQLMQRRTHNLLADEMGLGKTVQALGLINAEPSIRRVLVVAPASMKLVWQREAETWLIEPLPCHVIDGRSDSWQPTPEPCLVIVNYDLLGDYYEQLRAWPWDLAICDESHALRNRSANRTRQVIGHRPRRKKDAPPIEPIEPIPRQPMAMAHRHPRAQPAR